MDEKKSVVSVENTGQIYPESLGTEVSRVIEETERLIERFDAFEYQERRNIDDRDWLMSFINFNADRDQFLVQFLYENLKYRDWSSEEKKEYLNHFITIDKDGVQDGLLIQKRNVIWEEISYLLDNSMLFLDTPWIVRDFYDERTEFNYWYLIYLARVRYPHWMEERILPGMLELIPEDRITGVSYLWIKNPDSLCSMENEIVTTGYPWNSLLYLMDLNTFLQNEIEIINPSESDFILQNQGCLF